MKTIQDMKQLVLSITMLAAVSASAQTEMSGSVSTDSVMNRELQEIVVEAPKVIRKADMDVYIPSASAVGNSKNGMQLLTNVMIPGLTVVDALNSVTASGQSVQIRINGRQADAQQLRNLLPETIRKIEWIDNPGLRYGGANYVLNVVVANPTLGGSLMLFARPALNMAWGDYNADAKFNIGRSQWSVGGYYKMSEDLKIHRDYKEVFTFPDGHTLTRTETPLGGRGDNSFADGWLAYNYSIPDTTTIYIRANLNSDISDRTLYNGRMSLSNGTDDIYLTNATGSPGTTPSFSAYLEQHLPHKQTLVIDASASLYFGHSFSDYVEEMKGVETPITDVHTYIKDRNQAFGIEVDYIKNWQNSRLTAGGSYTANRNRSEYRNLGGEIFHQRQDKAYFFAEYFQRVKKFTFTAGLGAQYTSFLFKETDQGRDSWNLRPQATVTYAPAQGHQLRLSFTSWQSAPSLSQTNITPQQMDGFQWQVGNPNLQTSSSYMLTLRYNFQLPGVYATFGARAFTSPDAIAPCIYWEGDRLINTYENSKGLQNLSFWLSPQIEVVPGWLTVEGEIQYRVERMRGLGYRLYNHDWSGEASVMITHWDFVLTGQYQRAQRNLWGEKISWGEDINLIDLSYNWKSWQFSAGIIMPFGKYDHGSRSFSKWKSNEQHMRLNMRMPYISVSYNLQWGRQKRGVNKLINSDSSVDTSKAANR